MALGETARLIAELVLDDKRFTPNADRAIGKVGQLETSLGRIGGHAQRGLQNAAANLTVEEPAEEENPLATGTAVVRVNSLNVRTGPGTEYSRIASVNRDDQLAITGQVNNCAWLQIIAPDGTVGWVSGGAQYVSITANCADIPEVQAPPPPSNSSSSGSSGSSGASAGSLTPSGVKAG